MALQIVDTFTLHQFERAETALSKVAQIRPDLLLLDVMMPGTTGPQLWGSLRAMHGVHDIPTIFMTAKAEDEISADLIRQGALHVITKPFDPMTLGVQIREAWARRAW
jgi:DNA-binding response OmpR family regulator